MEMRIKMRKGWVKWRTIENPIQEKGITTHPFAKSKDTMNQYNGRKTIDTGSPLFRLVSRHRSTHIRFKIIIECLGEIRSHSGAEYVKPIY